MSAVLADPAAMMVNRNQDRESALMHRILIVEQRWLGEKRFLHALNYCMLLPGPEAMQLAVYIGWLMHRTLGGIIAGVLFVLPGVVAIMALSWVYALFGNVGPVEAVFFGLKAAVLAIVVQAVIRIGSRALKNGTMLGIAAASFVAIFGYAVPFPLIILEPRSQDSSASWPSSSSASPAICLSAPMECQGFLMRCDGMTSRAARRLEENSKHDHVFVYGYASFDTPHFVGVADDIDPPFSSPCISLPEHSLSTSINLRFRHQLPMEGHIVLHWGWVAEFGPGTTVSLIKIKAEHL